MHNRGILLVNSVFWMNFSINSSFHRKNALCASIFEALHMAVCEFLGFLVT